MANNRYDTMKQLLSIVFLLAMGLHLQAQDTLYQCSFASTADYTTGTVSSYDYIDGELVSNPHTITSSYSYWSRIPDTSYDLSSNYYELSSYSGNNIPIYMGSQYTGNNNGFVLLSMIDLGYYNIGTCNSYVAFPAVSTTSAQVVEVAWRQCYRKYYDQCFVDYQVSGQWYSMEVNVTGIDVEVNNWGSMEARYTLPLAAAGQSALQLRLRYFSTRQGTAYGYWWAVDNFTVIKGAPNQCQVTPEHFVDGNYDILPQGMQIPLTWYTMARNTGANTLTGTTVTMQHTSPAGATSTFLSESMPTLTNHGAYDTLVIDPRGFYNNMNANWVINGPNYGMTTISPIGNTGLPTTNAGLNRVQTTIVTDSLSHPYTQHTYTVSTAGEDSTYVWGYGNGVLAANQRGFYYGYTSSGYITDNEWSSSYHTAGSDVLVMLTTGNTVPTAADGEPWVFRGMEMVVAPSCTTAAGTSITPLLWKWVKDEDGNTNTETVATGVASYVVDEWDYTTLDTGYLMPGQYNTLRIMFPTQPVLEPNTAYYIGYTLNNDAYFALAVNSNFYYESYDGSQIRRFDTVPGMEAYYASSFQLNFGDVIAGSYNPYTGSYGWIYSGWNINYAPMMRALVGPATEIPQVAVSVNTSGAEVQSSASGTTFYSDGVDSVAVGSDAQYTVVPLDGYQISDIYVDGYPLSYGYIDYNTWSTSHDILDSLGNLIATYEATSYSFTLYGVDEPHTISVTATPVPLSNVTFNCPAEHATVTAYNPNGEWLGEPCGTHTYYYDYITYNISVESGYIIDTFLVDGVVAYPNASGNYTLYLDGSDHVLTLTVTTISCDTITAFPYHESFENGEAVNTCWTFLNSNEYGWQHNSYNPELAYTGSCMMISFSNINGDYGSNTDNWLISPAIQLPTSGTVQASWYNYGVYFGYEQYSLYISTTGTNISDFTLLDTYYAYDWWTRQEADLSAYAGQTVHIAFRHTYGNYVLLLDDLQVESGQLVSINCTGNGFGSVFHDINEYSGYYYDGSLCGQSELREPGFLASYDFLPGDGCTLAHLYVNDVDRINDVVTHSSGTSISYYTYSFNVTDSVTYLNPVFNYPSYNFTFNCTGGGHGYIYNTDTYEGNLCGEVDEVRQGFYASYEIYPSHGSEMTHLYVNGVDRMNDAMAHSYGSYSSTIDYYTYGLMATSDTLIEPVFTPLPFTITATVNDPAMGMVTGGGIYLYDSLVVLTATPMPHYRLQYWTLTYEDGDSQTFDSVTLAEFGIAFNPLQFECFGDLTVTAVFAPEQYTITAVTNNVAYGAVEGGGTFDYLQPVTLTATAFSGYHFMMWDNGSTYNPYVFPATEDLSLTAIFVSDNDTSSYFYVTVSVNDPTMGEADGGGIFLMGESTTLTATPFEGFRFVQWNDGNSDNPRTVTVTSNIEYIAYFADVTGIDDVDGDAVKVYSHLGNILVEGVAGRDVRLFDITGRLLTHVDRAPGNLAFDIRHAGVYVVTVGQTAYRIVVTR